MTEGETAISCGEVEVAGERKAFSPRLTVEIALYGLILCLSLALRLGGLDDRIMDLPEAAQAWQAWLLAKGELPSGSYGPLLLSGQTLLFGLFGASDGLARLLPALAGSAIVLLPYWMRSHLGRTGALASALALALSPTLVYSSRYGDGTMLLLACALGTLALWLAYQHERRPGYVYAIAVIDGLALLADPRVIGVWIVLAVAWAIERFTFGRDILAADALHPIPWRSFGLTLGGTLVLVGTALALNPGGLGAWADFVSAWWQHFLPVVNGHPWYYPLGALIVYEPFLLVFGVIGAVDLLARRDMTSILIWLALGFLAIALLAGGRGPGDVALVCMPLAVVAGRAVGNLVESWQKEARLGREGLLVLIALVLLAYVGLEVSFYARATYLSLPQAGQFLWLLLLSVALVVVLFGVTLAWFGSEITWRAAGGVMAIVLVLSAFSLAVGLNFRHDNDPRELHVLETSNEGTGDALQVMADLSFHERGYPTAASVTVDAALGPVWLWYLRDWEDVTVVDDLTPSVTTLLVLADEEVRPALGERYTGQDFVTRTSWQPTQLVSNDQLSWWLYRKSVNKPVPIQKVILWVRADETVAGEE